MLIVGSEKIVRSCEPTWVRVLGDIQVLRGYCITLDDHYALMGSEDVDNCRLKYSVSTGLITGVTSLGITRLTESPTLSKKSTRFLKALLEQKLEVKDLESDFGFGSKEMKLTSRYAGGWKYKLNDDEYQIREYERPITTFEEFILTGLIRTGPSSDSRD